ncbi:MAG: hypothetical protein LBR86_09140 [Tannerella sp.]|jgi:hypothetical protein|nr:hypothetical protein [Tannerella sp.]
METKQTKLDELKGRNPFQVPDGYLKGLTGQIMSRLPEKPREETKVISLYERIRPWLYLAAVFAGLIFLFKALNLPFITGEGQSPDESLYVQIAPSEGLLSVQSEEDEDFLEYLETNYYNGVFTEEMEKIE